MVREPVQVLEEQYEFLVRQPLTVPLVPHEGTIRAEGCPPRRRHRGGREGVERAGSNGAVHEFGSAIRREPVTAGPPQRLPMIGRGVPGVSSCRAVPALNSKNALPREGGEWRPRQDSNLRPSA